MKSIFATICLLLLSQPLYAEIGYIYKADLNNDGKEDSLMSGPRGMFGNGGGPFLLLLSTPDGTYKQKILGLHPLAAALERNGKNSKIWGYWHMNAESGRLGYTLLDGSFKSESITLSFGSDPDGVSGKIYKLIFNGPHLIEFKEIENYTPPEYPWGKG